MKNLQHDFQNPRLDSQNPECYDQNNAFEIISYLFLEYVHCCLVSLLGGRWIGHFQDLGELNPKMRNIN